MSEEWGPWIEHDGSGCPVKWMYVQIEAQNPVTKFPVHYVQISDRVLEGMARPGSWGRSRNSWNWQAGNFIIRYRIRKPRAMTMLEEIAKGVKQPQEADQ